MSVGTVSKILWHFTGGREFDVARAEYVGELKTNRDSARVIELILESMKLKVGQFKEKIMIDGNTLETNQVCCVADIPSVHLSTHAKRYGKCAIGFHREALIRNGFNPVFYIRQDKAALTDLQKSFSQVSNFDLESSDFLNLMQRNFNDEISQSVNDEISIELASMRNKVYKLKEAMSYFQSFLKTINQTSDWNDIYLEREWRYPHDYNFAIDDIAMIVLPKADQIFQDFCNSELATNLPRKIPIIAFEDLVEH